MSTLEFISEDALNRAARRALWRGFWSPGGLELSYSLARAMRLSSGSLVLDAGSGSGESAVYLAEVFGWQMTALDEDDFALALARDKAEHPGLPLDTVHGDLLALPFANDRFDGVFAQGSFFMLGERRAEAAHEWARVLKAGGVLGIGEPTLTRAGHSQHSPAQVTLNETAALLAGAGLTVELSQLHPDGSRMWAEFHAPHLDAAGRVRRSGMEASVQALASERDLLGIGVLVARKG